MMLIVNLLEKLIDKMFYEKVEIQNKVNVFYAMNVINEEQFADLILKIEEKYAVVEIPAEETEVATEEVTE